MPYSLFLEKLNDNDILNAIVNKIKESHGADRFNRGLLEYALKQGDRDLYVKYRDKEITYDQLRARGAKLHGLANYIVLDDIKKKLNPSIINDMAKAEK